MKLMLYLCNYCFYAGEQISLIFYKNVQDLVLSSNYPPATLHFEKKCCPLSPASN